MARTREICERGVLPCGELELGLAPVHPERDGRIVANADPDRAGERVVNGDLHPVRSAERQLRIDDPPDVTGVQPGAPTPVDGGKRERADDDDDRDRDERRRRRGDGERDGPDEQQAEQARSRDRKGREAGAKR